MGDGGVGMGGIRSGDGEGDGVSIFMVVHLDLVRERREKSGAPTHIW